jgi:APA family basic amino acid/polyamine antiporter
LYGWLSLLGSFSGAVAALALGASGTLVDIVGAWFGPSQVGKDTESMVVAVALVWSLTGLACLQVQVAARLQLAITGTLMALLLCGAVTAIATEPATAATVTVPLADAVPVLGAFAGIFFAYSGWNGATYVAGEIRQPQRNLPWALLSGTVAVAVLYLALNAAFVVLLPDLAQAGAHGVIGQLGVRHPRLGEAVQVVAALCMVGAALASTVTGARISYAMAQDGLFFHGIGTLHEDWGTPVRALVLQAAWTTALIVFGQSVGQLLGVSAVAMMLLSAGTVAAVITLRRRNPQAQRPFRTPLYPLTPAVYLLAMALVLAATAMADPGLFLGGIAAIALGWVGFFVHRRQRR